MLRDTSLVTLVRSALRDNRDLRVAYARITEFRSEAGVTHSTLFPRLDANASASENKIAIGASPPISYNAIRATGDLGWEVDFFGRIRRTLAAANAETAARDADERALVLTLVADVSTGYLSLLEFRDDLDISERTLVSRQATLNLARQRYTQGLISELDVRQFEADVAAAASAVAQFSRSAAQQEHALSLLIGQIPGPIAATGTLDSAVVAVSAPDSVSADLLGRRPDVMSAEREFAAAKARIGADKAALLPAFMITGEYGRQNTTVSQLFGADHEIYTLSAGVSMPIFSAGGGTSAIAADRARADQARSRYEQTVLAAMSEAADALVAVRTSRDELASETTRTNALREAFRLATRRYEGGIASYLEVLDAQRGLFSAELSLNAVRRQYLSATVQLYKALGGRWMGN